MRKSKLESERISLVLRNKTVDKREKFTHTRTHESQDGVTPFLILIERELLKGKMKEVV